MLLSVGDEIGPYEILAPIGVGGMGEVWKARDKRLNRIVAIKTSKAQFSERFAREAQAIAALNHPHICQVYDVGPDYLVLEYVEGSLLKGPLPVQKAVELAGQVLRALDAAHRKGIIHRDLKPANILVNRQHGVKLLDFGLARIASGSADVTVTQPGEKMGTPAYMAPEQWEGKPGDARTDIYCFGCVFYEMLTGRLATRDGRISIESPVLESIVVACLEEAPEDRWQSAGDILRALTLPAPPKPQPRRVWQWVGAAAFAILVGGLLLRETWLTPAPAAGDVVSLAIYPPDKNAFSNSPNVTVNVPQFALAPDGRTIVFAAGPEGGRPLLWRRSLAEVTPEPLPGTEDAQDPFWSPDGRWVAFFAEGKLKKVPAAGGAVQTVAPTVRDVRGGAWGRDDTILFANGVDAIQRVPAAGGQPTPATIWETGEATQRFPQFLPDGRHFVYLSRGVRNGQTGVYVGSVEGKLKKLAARIDNSAIYAVPGYLLFGAGDSLYGQLFDAAHLQASGQPFLIAEYVGNTTTGKSAISASASGTIAYAGTLSPKGALTWFGRDGRALDSIGPEGYYADFRLSPNEHSVAASLFDPKAGVIEVWIIDLARGSSNPIPREGARISASPIWSPDGAQLAFRRSLDVVQFYRRSAAGGGADQLILPYENIRAAGIQSLMLMITDWSPDGNMILFSVPDPNSGTDLWLLPLTGNKTPVRFLGSAADEMHGNFSPDGRLVAYTSTESGRPEVFVQTLPLSDKKSQVSTNGGYEPRWRSDGREIYYLSQDRKLMAVTIGAGPSFGVPKVLFQTRVPASVTPNRTHYVPSRDGQRFLVNIQNADASPPFITVVTNWAASLKR